MHIRLNIVWLLASLYSCVWGRLIYGGDLRIVNGTDAHEDEFPYMVQVCDKSGWFLCGGSIIGPKWILTAGHCIKYSIGGSIVYGTNSVYNGKPAETSIEIKNTYLHPKFDYFFTGFSYIPYYDVGILELKESIPFSNKAQPISLANFESEVLFHVEGVLAGWGYDSSSGYVVPHLQKVYLQLLSDYECTQQIYGESGVNMFNSTHNLCSNDHYNGQCTGDSGSPFVLNGKQIGIASWSFKPCGEFPGTYSRTTNPEYRIFIKDISGV